MPRVNKIEIIIGAKDDASKVLGGVGKALGGIGKIAAGASLAVVGAAAGIGVALGKLAIDAAPLEGIGFAFDKMADRVGLSLDELREASAGTVSDFELMRKANIALTGAGDELGKEFGKNLPRLMEAARAAAKATGQDVDFLFESLVTGVKRGSPMLIDNTGLVVKLGEANEAMAAKLGKAVEELTAEEKSIALLNATVAAGQRMIDEFGGGALTVAESMAQVRATIKNTTDQIGLAMLPALQAILEPIAGLTQEYGPQLVEMAKQLGAWLGENLPKAIETLTAILSGEMPAAIGNLQPIFQAVLAVLREVADVFINEVWPNLKMAFDSITEALNTLGLDWKDVFVALLTATAVVVVSLVAVLAGIVTAISKVVAHVATVLADMVGTFKKGLESIAKIVGGVMAIIKGIFTLDLKLILAGIKAFGEGTIGIWKAMGEGIVNAIRLTFGTVIAAVTGFISSVINFFTGLAETLVGRSIVRDMMDAMLDIIRSTLADILGRITGFVADVINAFSGLADTLYDIGSNIMESLKDGIMSKVEGILSAIRDIIQNLIDEARDALDILSPSGVFQDIGRAAMEGMALGIAGSAGVPALAAAGAAAGVARTTNNYFNLTVHSRAETSPVIQSFETMRALVG